MHEFKHRHNKSQALTGYGVKDPLLIGQTVLVLNFRSGDKSLEDQCGRGHPSVIDNKHLKILIRKNPS